MVKGKWLLKYTQVRLPRSSRSVTARAVPLDVQDIADLDQVEACGREKLTAIQATCESGKYPFFVVEPCLLFVPEGPAWDDNLARFIGSRRKSG